MKNQKDFNVCRLVQGKWILDDCLRPTMTRKELSKFIKSLYGKTLYKIRVA